MECFLLSVLLARIVIDTAQFTSVNTSSDIVTSHSASMLPTYLNTSVFHTRCLQLETQSSCHQLPLSQTTISMRPLSFPIADKLRQRLFHTPGQTPVFDDIIRNFTRQTDNP
jgi:hypothetical protein